MVALATKGRTCQWYRDCLGQGRGGITGRWQGLGWGVIQSLLEPAGQSDGHSICSLQDTAFYQLDVSGGERS